MTSPHIKKKLNHIYSKLKQRELKNALERIKEFSIPLQNWVISEKITELTTNYKFMLHYLIEGKEDPEQRSIYNKLLQDLYMLAEDIGEQLLLPDTASIFFDRIRIMDTQPSPSIKEYISMLNQQVDTLSFIDLLEDGPEKKTRFREQMSLYESTQQDFFYTVFASPRADNNFIISCREFIDTSSIPLQDKALLISALTMNVLQRFDSLKIELLLDLCKHSSPELSARAVTGIIPILQIYDDRLSTYSECMNRLEVLSDDKTFTRRATTAVIGLIQTHETEKIAKRLTEEIIPEMIKLSPMLGKKINLDEWMGDNEIDEKNPEWEKILDDNKLTNKLQEITEMQLEGADVFHSTFSNLKSYPFFQHLSNWFLPFNSKHSSLEEFFHNESGKSDFLDTISSSSLLCNSDKYSFCFSIMMFSKNHRDMLSTQLGSESNELKSQQTEEELLSPYQQEETAIRQYIKDLYRFFKVFPRRNEFYDIFELPLNFHQLSSFHPIIRQPKYLEKIALYYFEKNYFSEALSAYTLLAESKKDQSQIWQKMGYCQQMLLNIREALKSYLHADLLEGNNTWLLNRIAHCYRVLKKPNTALEYYRRLEQLRPDDHSIQLNIGHCYLEMGEYDKALNYYFKIEILNSNSTQAWRSIAWCAFLSRKFDVAEKYYSRILNVNPNTHDYLNAGHVALCLEQKKKALELYNLSLNKTGNFIIFHTMLIDDMDELKRAGVDINIIPIILDKIRYDKEL